MPQVYRAIRPMFQHNQWRIFPDDVVQMLTGPEKGVTGKVLAVIKDTRQPEVIVEGVNLRKKKVYVGLKEDDFFVVSMEAPVSYANVMLVDPVSKKPVKTIFRYLPDGTKVRLGLGKDAGGQIIPIPQQKSEEDGKYGLCGTKDTPEDEVRRVTYDPVAPFPFERPSSRASGLPTPAEPDTSSPASPVDKGSWAAPAWLGAPRSTLDTATPAPESSPSATSPAPGRAADNPSPGPLAGLRGSNITAGDAGHNRGGAGASVYEWIVRQQQAARSR